MRRYLAGIGPQSHELALGRRRRVIVIQAQVPHAYQRFCDPIVSYAARLGRDLAVGPE